MFWMGLSPCFAYSPRYTWNCRLTFVRQQISGFITLRYTGFKYDGDLRVFSDMLLACKTSWPNKVRMSRTLFSMRILISHLISMEIENDFFNRYCKKSMFYRFQIIENEDVNQIGRCLSAVKISINTGLRHLVSEISAKLATLHRKIMMKHQLHGFSIIIP